MIHELRFKKKFFIFWFLLLASITIHSSLFTRPVFAHCPLCVAGAAAGITLTRWVGVDDSITGVWIAALLGGSSFWLDSYLIRKSGSSISLSLRSFIRPLLYIFIFVVTIWSFYKFQLVIRMSQIMGLDKLTFGMVAGGALFLMTDYADNVIIEKNRKVFFPYQRVVVSLGSMIILSLGIYILINYFI